MSDEAHGASRPECGRGQGVGDVSGGAPCSVFLSYRRAETAYPAGWLFDRLTEHLGKGRVFKDVDSLAPGDNFPDVIAQAVGSCDVLLALIGDQWVSITDADGKRRLDDPTDWVRLEIETGLARPDVRVVPVLVDGARMPEPEDVPTSLVRLVSKHALELSPNKFDADLVPLLALLHGRQPVGDTPEPTPDETESWFDHHHTLLVAAAALLVLAVVGAVVWFAVGGGDDGVPVGPALPSTSLVVPLQVDNNTDLYVVDTTTTGRGAIGTRLTSEPVRDGTPVLRQDRRSVAYIHGDSDEDVWVVGTDGSGARELFAHPTGCGQVTDLAWSPTEPAHLTLVCQSRAGRYSLLVVDLGGQVVRTLVADAAGLGDPAYSPDGHAIAYWQRPQPGSGRGSLARQAVSGGAPIAVTSTGADSDPVWSPDGRRLAFARHRGKGRTDIVVTSRTGQDPVTVTTAGLNDQPAWSPDDEVIAYVGRADRASDPDLFLVGADGSGRQALHISGPHIGTPVWGHR